MRKTVRIAVAALAGGLLLAACGGGDPNTTTYRDANDRTLFELPIAWNVYVADELTQLGEIAFIPDLGGGYPAISFVAFDGAAGRDLQNITLDVTQSPYPIGAHVIRSINPQDKDLLSRNTLALSAYDLATAQGVQAIESEDFTFGREYDGIRRLVGLTGDDGELAGAIYILAVTNPEATEMYSMAAGCSLACFNEQADEIFKAVDSWLVNTRR